MDSDKMWRASVVIPSDVEQAIIDMRKRDEFARCSISEILRSLINRGLESYEQDKEDKLA